MELKRWHPVLRILHCWGGDLAYADGKSWEWWLDWIEEKHKIRTYRAIDYDKKAFDEFVDKPDAD